MVWEPLQESPCDVCHCTRLFRNAFKIKGTPESAVKKSTKSSTRTRRLIGMAARRMSSPELGSSPCANSQNHECSAIFSPNGQNSTPHKTSGFKSSKLRLPLEEFDPNSQDSGYGGSASSGSSYSEEKAQLERGSFQFAEPLGVAPRRLSLESRSPMKSPLRSSPQRKRLHRPALFHSLSSGYESTDDGFNDLIDMDSLESEITRLPNGLSSLISGDIVTASEHPMDLELASTTPEAAATTAAKAARTSFCIRRPASGHSDTVASEGGSPPSPPGPPSGSKVRSCLFRSPNASSSAAKLGFDEAGPRLGCPEAFDSPPARLSFKRPEPPGVDHSPLLVKRSRKCASFQELPRAATALLRPSQSELAPRGRPSSPPGKAALLVRSRSETEAHAHIKSAIHRSTTDSDLTGDFSKACALPLADGQHEDLKSISSETLSRLMRGEFRERVNDFKIVDCRYPYEYEAGHIKGALNLYSKEMIESFLLDPLKHTPEIEPQASRRSILVFHCEFSWERGPNLSRFLRNVDRQRNKEHYPALHYPEIYLLHGGYQKFYKDQRELCWPQGYRPMRHPDHEADLRQFRSKSKSWQADKVTRANAVASRANLKRLAF